VYSSVTYSASFSTLTVQGLSEGVAYYVRAGALNFNQVPNFYTLSNSTVTMPSVPSSPHPTTVYLSSITVAWTTVAGATGYEVDASTASNFTGVIKSTVTTDGTRSSLAVDSTTSLSANTTYYLKVGSLYTGVGRTTPIRCRRAPVP